MGIFFNILTYEFNNLYWIKIKKTTMEKNIAVISEYNGIQIKESPVWVQNLVLYGSLIFTSGLLCIVIYSIGS